MPPVFAAIASVVTAVAGAATTVVAALGLTSVATALGMSAFTFLATGVTIGYSLLAGGRPKPKNSRENLDRLRASIDPRTPRKSVIGETAMKADAR